MNEAKTVGGFPPRTLGVIAIVLGVLSMVMPGLTGFSIVMMIGILVLLAGMLRMFWAFMAGSIGKGLMQFALGVLTLLCGVALLSNPMFAAGMLTLALAIYLIMDGAAEIGVGMNLRPRPGSGWLIFGGVMSIFLGVMLWMQMPLSGVWAIGILLGVKLFMVGMIMVSAVPPAEGQAA